VAAATSRRAVGPPGATSDRTGWGSALLFAAIASAAVLAIYLTHEIVEEFRFPVGPDGPVYTWWSRSADVEGLAGVARGRPGVPGATLVLGTALGTEPVETVMLLGPVMAATAGLAAAALLEATLGPHRLRSALAVLLMGTFAAYLAGGWLANLAQAALFLGALAALALVLRGWRAVWAGAGLLTAAGLTHRVFFLIALGVLAGAILRFLPGAWADLRAGRRLRDAMALRLGLGALGGVTGAGLGLVAVGGGPTIPGDTSQDGFFRRLGLVDLLRDRYRERTAGDAARMAVPLATTAALATAAAVGRGPRRSTGHTLEGRYLVAVLVTWSALTVVGVPTLLLTEWGPANRLLVFAFFVPLTAAVGAAALMASGRRVAAAGAVVAVLAFAGFASFGWYRQYPSFAPEELEAAREAGRLVGRLEPGVPVIFLVDTTEPAAAFHVTRFGNVIRMGLPPDRIALSFLAVGSPRDFLAGRITSTGDPEHDRIARAYLRESRGIRARAVILVLAPFNAEGYREAVASGREVRPGIVVLSAPEGTPASPPGLGSPPPPAPGLGPVELVVLSLAAVGLLLALGLGWARWALPGTGTWGVAALAPAAGLGVAVIAGFLTDRVVPGAAAPWGLPAAVLLGGGGYVAAAAARRSSP
jgi:hypothetical protein